ncbi:PAS domain-containing protein [Roseibium sediminicola]|uniref:PAS domain-containing protein n=1 Tax=Roseibium sediminicola TaxID=2933272 RepID=A0ABT0H0T6_9HYPH|nr:PAS domain-containing protein [Roseibium sp. CAU 1639]MCK7614680.1 PAS domain-containing protein [Roseibium sp. CAU 1639]
MPTDLNILLRSMRQLVPNSETNALLFSMGISYWGYDPMREEICWQRTDVASVRGYRLAKLPIKQALQYYHQPDRTPFLQMISNAVEHGLSAPLRLTMKTEAGDKLFDLVAARVLRGVAPLVVGLMRECPMDTPAKLEVPSILHSLSHAFVAAPNAILVTDRMGVIRSANRQFLTMFAIKDAKNIIGRDARMVPNHIGKKLSASFASLFSNSKSIQDSFKLAQADGTEKTVLFSLHPLALEHANGGCVFVGEYTNKAQEIAATEILDAVPTPILVADLNSRRIKYANNAGRGELGLTPAQIGRERLTDKLLSPTDVRDLTLVLDNVGWDGGRVWQVHSHIGLKRHYRIRTCFIGDHQNRQIVLEFLPARIEKDQPGNEKARGFFSRLFEINFAK